MKNLKLTVAITMENDAFFDSSGAPLQGPECARLLRQVANTVADQGWLGGLNKRLIDVNGNRVGEARVTQTYRRRLP